MLYLSILKSFTCTLLSLKDLATSFTMENIICWLFISLSASFSASFSRNSWSRFWLSFKKAKYSALPLDSVFLDLLTGGWVDELAFLAAWLPSLSRVVLKKSDSENVRSSSPDSADVADFWPFCLDEFGVVAKRFLPFLAADSRLKSARERVCSSPSLILSSSPDSDNSSSDGPGIAELLSSKPR